MKRGYLALVFSFIILNMLLVSGMDTIQIPTSCSDAAITATWNSAFNDYSSDITDTATLLTDTNQSGKCNAFYAYKTDGNLTYILAGKDFNSEVKIVALHANATQTFIDKIKISSVSYDEDKVAWLFSGLNLKINFNNRNEPIPSKGQAESKASEFFQPDSAIPFNESLDFTAYRINEEQTAAGKVNAMEYIVLINQSAEWIIFRQTNSAACTESWNCTAWSSCINNVQTKTCTDINSCNTTISKPITNQSCNLTICYPLWNCTAWSSCADNTQTRGCKDLHYCGITDNNTRQEIQVCNSTITCTPSWDCEDWPSNCPETGQKERKCEDTNDCSLDRIETQTCHFKSALPIVIIISIIIVIIAAVAGLIIYRLRKPTEYTEIKVTDNSLHYPQ